MDAEVRRETETAKTSPPKENILTRRISPRGTVFAPPLLLTSSSRRLARRTDSIIREGDDFQVRIEDDESQPKDGCFSSSFASSALAESGGEMPITRSADEETDRDVCVWKPSEMLSDGAILEYCQEANQRFDLSMEQSLYLLLLEKYDMERARSKLRRSAVVAEKLTDEEQATFRYALSCFGKNFSKIQQLIPSKSVSALVDHYYRTKTLQKYHCFAGNEKKSFRNLQRPTDSEDYVDEAKLSKKGAICENCLQQTDRLFLVNELELCCACKAYFLLTNEHRPCRRPVESGFPPPRTAICPDDMRDVAEEFPRYARYSVDDDDATFVNADQEGELQIVCSKVTECEKRITVAQKDIQRLRTLAIRTDCQARQEWRTICGGLRQPNSGRNGGDFAFARAFLERTAAPRSRMTYLWNHAERVIAFKSLVQYNRDFAAVANVLGTKTADMVKSFYEDKCKVEVDKAVEERIAKLVAKSLVDDNGYKQELKSDSFVATNNNKCEKPDVIELD